jgi:hypothetical protein
LFSVTKTKNFVIVAFAYVSESSALLNDDFCMNSHIADSDEAIKRGDEALNASSLQFLEAFNASSLHRYDFLLSVKRFIAVTF